MKVGEHCSPRGLGETRSERTTGFEPRDPHLGKVMLYQLSHVRTTASDDRSPSVRSRTIAEPEAGVQTSWRRDPPPSSSASA